MKQLFFLLNLAIICFTSCTETRPILETGAEQWKMVWNDEFDYKDSQLDSIWIAENQPTSLLCSRWRENALIKDGNLHLQLRKENRGGKEWTAASIWTKKLFQYGYFECRYKYAGATGTNNSFWICNTRTVIKEGKKFEIDINEGHYPNKVNTCLHDWGEPNTKSNV